MKALELSRRSETQMKIIKKLELHGFKSFSDRTRILFHPGITAIIGPNGTGKSNIVDSLLWVFRGSRLKSLRGARSGDVIFNGNSKKAPFSMCEVSLFLGDTKDKEKEDIKINHRVFRSGESEYRLNGKAVRLKDIQETLWKNAIGETDYFVIEQGSIGDFLASKPLEKRLLLEEAAGTAHYKDIKRQTQNKLNNSEQNLIRLEDIIIEVEKAKNALKRQAGAAIRYRKLREHIRELSLLLYRKKIEQAEKDQKDTAGIYNKNLDRENEIISLIKHDKKNLATKRKDIWNLEKIIKEKQEKLYSLKSQHSHLEAEQDRNKKRIEFLKEKKNTAKSSSEELTIELTGIKEEQSEGTEKLSDLEKLLLRKQKKLDIAGQDGLESRKDLKARKEKIEINREKFLKIISSQTELKNEAVKREKEIELIQRQEEKLSSEITSENSLSAKIKTQLEKKKLEISKIQTLINNKNKEFKDTQEKLSDTISLLADFEKKRAEHQNEREKNVHHLYSLEKLKAQEQSSCITPKIPNSMGLFADKIDSSTEHALLIDVFFKEEAKATLIRAGDFIKLSSDKKIKGYFLLLGPENKKELASSFYEDPKVLGLLKSHIQADSEIKNRLFPLPEAAIVRDIKTAVELWLKNPSFNFITLQGDTLLSSGILKSGEKKEGLFAISREIKNLKENITQIDKNISPLSLQIAEKITEKTNLENLIREYSSSKSGLERKVEDLIKEQKYDRVEQDKTKTKLTILNKEKQNLNKEKQNLSEALKAQSDNIKQLDRDKTILKQNSEAEENELSQLQKESEQSRKLFFEIKSSIDITKEKINSLEHININLSEREKNLNNRIESIKTDINKSEEENISLQKKIAQHSSKAVNFEKETKEKETELMHKESHLGSLQKEQQKIEENVQQLREKQRIAEEERVKWEVRKAEKERDLVNLEESCWQEINKTLDEVKKEVHLDSDPGSNIVEDLSESREKLQKYSAVNLMAEDEYLAKKKRYDFLIKEKEDLKDSIETTRTAIKKIDQESKTQFIKALIAVNKNFQDIFSILFKGGIAKVKLSDEDNPLDSGVEIIAQPPGKKFQSLTLLSGGEKSLTSLAFFFALFRYKPAPFCVLDEVDAALDEANLLRFLNLMRKIKDQTQFIIITHNYKTMEVADYIYGTTMAEPNITSIYSVKIKDRE